MRKALLLLPLMGCGSIPVNQELADTTNAVHAEILNQEARPSLGFQDQGPYFASRVRECMDALSQGYQTQSPQTVTALLAAFPERFQSYTIALELEYQACVEPGPACETAREERKLLQEGLKERLADFEQAACR